MQLYSLMFVNMLVPMHVSFFIDFYFFSLIPEISLIDCFQAL